MEHEKSKKEKNQEILFGMDNTVLESNKTDQQIALEHEKSHFLKQKDSKKSKKELDKKEKNKLNVKGNNQISDDKKNQQIEQKIKNKQEEKSNSSNDSKPQVVPALIVLSVTLAVIMIAVLIAFWQVNKTALQARNNLEAVFSSAYFSMVDSANNLHVNSAKFESIDDEETQKATLGEMSQDCDYILAGLSVLPMDMPNNTALTKFFNQIDGMCEAFINKIDKNGKLDNEDLQTISNNATVIGELKASLNGQNEMVASGNFNFVDASVFNGDGISEFSASLGDLSNDAIEYPAMIFDGPFSTSLETKEVKGLDKKIVSKEDAEKLLKEKVFKDKDADIKFSRKTEGDFTTYDFDIEIDGTNYDAQVTEKGGFLLTLSAPSGEHDATINEEKAVEIAEKFAKHLGFDNLKSVWQETKNNVSYINLAPIQNDVILYPDLIKAKVDLTHGEVIGWEARNYAFNHVESREIDAESTEEEAMQKLGKDYKVLNANLAYIPLDEGGEVLTYEFETEKMDGTYYFYVNSSTAKMEKILKVVESDGMELLI